MKRIRAARKAAKGAADKAAGVSIQVESKIPRGRSEEMQEAARALNISPAETKRNLKIPHLSDEAKGEVRDGGLQNNQQALVKAARSDHQGSTLREIARTRKKQSGREPKAESRLETPRQAYAIQPGRQCVVGVETHIIKGRRPALEGPQRVIRAESLKSRPSARLRSRA